MFVSLCASSVWVDSQEFGRVIRWNRQSDPVSGQLAAFGFCEFADPVGASKCVSCLSGLRLQGRALVVGS